VKLTSLHVKQLITSVIILLSNYYDLNKAKCRGQGFIAAFIDGGDKRWFFVAAADLLASNNKCQVLTKILQ
jgi:hypothetical protein